MLPTTAEPLETPGFQPPRSVDTTADCQFYHAMDLPGYGFQPGEWDLRDDVDNYLGNQDFRGKKVVDVGTGSGFLCFEMEKRGADVTAVERFLSAAEERARDTLGQIPYADFQQRFGMTVEERIAE